MLLTRIPLRTIGTPAPNAMASAVWVMPLVGGMVGACGGAIYWLAYGFNLPSLLAALLALLTTVVITGALHEDGVSDFFDGLGGRQSKQRKLEIMRDSRIGTYGAAALFFSLSIRAVGISSLHDPAVVWIVLLTTGVLSRMAIPIVLATTQPARTDGLGASVASPNPWVIGVAFSISVAVAVVVMEWNGLVLLCAATVVAVLIGQISRKQFGGYTGDVLGAAVQLSEIAALITALLILGQL